MRTAKQQARHDERERNRTHDRQTARANAQHPSAMCQQGYHPFCIESRWFCTCECHRPKATARQREEW